MILFLLAAASAAAADTPKAFVERVYANYAHENYSPFTHPQRVFAPQLLVAIKEDERLAKGEVGFLDGDPLCDCQDTGGMHSKVTSVTPTGSGATAHILVTWDGTSDKRDIQLMLIKTAGGWRIADVGTKDDRSLLNSLRAANRQASKH